ncbi:MAG: branched-chain amino acid ABC transporter permease [Candidatus Protistobacter heckmanni]|nr:branched-chain amino acid ABC transporter permease [Candidatus Protistobacter heckmanni]
MLFLLAAGLTLVFGIMNVINLTHGAFYMVGAFCAAAAMAKTGSFGEAALAALAGAGLYGLDAELLVVRHLYRRDHLDQVLATLGMTLFTNELVSMAFGRRPPTMDMSSFLAGLVQVLPGLMYPVMRLAFIAAGVFVAVGLWLLITRTRVGMLVRAGADDCEMVDALGIDIRHLYTLIFALGAVLCGFAGVMAAPLLAVEIGMGERILITAFVVIVVGGVGSVRGALVGTLLIGMIDAFGRAYIPLAMHSILPAQISDLLSSGLVSSSIYILMAVVLLFRLQGLLGNRT